MEMRNFVDLYESKSLGPNTDRFHSFHLSILLATRQNGALVQPRKRDSDGKRQSMSDHNKALAHAIK